MKRMLVFILLTVLTLSFAACDTSHNSNVDSTVPATTAPVVTETTTITTIDGISVTEITTPATFSETMAAETTTKTTSLKATTAEP